MDLTLLLIVLVSLIAFIFDFTNGFHDAANAIATSVATRAMKPIVAIVMAAGMNFLGALLGTGVAETIGSGIISPPQDDSGLIVVLSGLLGAIGWNIITWWFGLPSSSSHALIGGLTGAGIAAAVTVHWVVIGEKVIIPMFLSPVVGFVLAYLLMSLLLRALKYAQYRTTMHRFRRLQIISSAAVALGHGLQDAQKTMGVVVLALVAGGYHQGTDIPLWVKFGAALAISLGTLTGGKRIMKTLGQNITDVDPSRGFVSEMVGAAVLYTTAFLWHAPVSTTHVITSGVMGVGATRRRSAVRWSVAGNIVMAWFLTLPAAGFIAMIFYSILHAIMHV
ncbi:MAG: inorganic phosphate transporter [Actinomycetaceae bacterium]|nr:inorganic phosphate transporter [Arcanobacterium sp.]MDD7687115.1 inorganic phosphate transporter [Actinomycetaceae bacterium]MDY5273220.1 inorganic phosphate transporter [Arcanobacterium sp.]